jgi:putative hydrolases of HD superfamily
MPVLVERESHAKREVGAMGQSDLSKCVEFLNEIEKLKIVYRQNSVVGNSRNENSAEHSWHIAIMAIVLQGFSDAPSIDIFKVVKMLLIHDLVEIDVGDTFLYGADRNKLKEEREIAAAKRLFGLLPEKIGTELSSLWEEFEGMATPEAKFARALDSLQPLMNHLLTQNKEYLNHKVKTGRVIEKKQHIAQASAALWEYAKGVIRRSEKVGLYRKQ